MQTNAEVAAGRRPGAVDRVLLAVPRSFCAGVEMAIKALAWMVRTFEPPVYCYHQIVHNQLVVDRFCRAGVVFVDDIADVPEGAPLMLSAHGSAPEVIAAARARSDRVVDAICPLVKKIHHEVRQRIDRGHSIVYAGHPGHDEAVGTMAVAPAAISLVETRADVAALPDADGPVAFLAQTTLAVDDWTDLLDATRDRFGDVWVPDHSDLCFATTNRQAAVRALAPRCDAMVVVGSANSSNTAALVQVARRTGCPEVVLVDRPDEVPDDLAGTVGLTAGASAPEDAVREVLVRLAPRNGVEVVDVTGEDEYFPLPGELRQLLRAAGTEALLDDDRQVAAADVLGQLALLDDPEVVTVDDVTEAVAVLGALAPDIEQCMSAVVNEEVADPTLRGAIGYHLGWLDESFSPPPPPRRRHGGKKLRGSLAVLAFRAAAADGVDRVGLAVQFAAAIELAHNWSLVHDDIVDGDRTRRGRPTVWALCGVGQAVHVGDCLHALAFRALARLARHGAHTSQVDELVSRLAAACLELTDGQMRDLAYETDLDVGVDDYLEMVERKTGALMRCAASGGTLLGGGSAPASAASAAFGRSVGIAFQIRDDILGIWGSDAETGKPTGSDIRRRKKTLPVVYASPRPSPATVPGCGVCMAPTTH